MLNQQTIEKLHAMKLHGIADAFRAQLETTEASQLSFEERFAMLVDQQWLWKENRALARRLRAAHLKERGVIEDVDYHHPRGLDRRLVRTLSSSDWVRQHPSVLLLGPTGNGKSWLACALAHKACRDGFSVLHKRTSELFRELAVAHADGSIGRFLVRLSRIDILLPVRRRRSVRTSLHHQVLSRFLAGRRHARLRPGDHRRAEPRQPRTGDDATEASIGFDVAIRAIVEWRICKDSSATLALTGKGCLI